MMRSILLAASLLLLTGAVDCASIARTGDQDTEEFGRPEPTSPFALAPETREIIAACGLDLRRYTPVAGPGGETIGDDFDGDGSLDFAVRIERREDLQIGVAVCRAGTWLNLLGFSPLGPSCPQQPHLTLATTWRALSPDEARSLDLPSGGPRLPDVDGDAILYPGTEGQVWHFGFRGRVPVCTLILASRRD